jgi:hypothetical protein
VFSGPCAPLYIDRVRIALIPPAFAILLAPAVLAAQSAGPGPAAPAPLVYRGFALAASLGKFTARARALAARMEGEGAVICNTSRRTAQLMECGAHIWDATDSADFYLAAYVLEGRVAFLSFGDSGAAPLVERLQRDLQARFGRPHASRPAMWEWRPGRGREVVRLTWRGRGSARWVYIALWDERLMDRIAKYVPPPR